ncbi:serine/threonine-protein kinase [Streptomyces sp. MUM 178J]|uniref:serine/threonine-protein kinase n=1 Tax=Streptomyces sp. MUM 178J TaxID=2791991 RepID=UPI002E7B3746|nr:serine/threonine-protein kinase [Streptomyces sp. MUM 178J]WRQ80333.1 serine/threonine-protein kinase [Streptomyces sp. MUM 178J]
MSASAQQGTVFKPLGEDDPQHVAGYRLAARLGAGGMGKVYLSYTLGGRPVAIKVIRPDFGQDAEFRRRFAQEVQAAQRVQGLYTAPVIDADPDAEQPWLATAYVPGPSLADAVNQHGKLPVETVLLLVAGIAEALHVIHGAGIVHRDLKPANVLLAADGPRVIDFGIARAADATSLTGSGVTIGTPSFMAPEQAAGSHVTPATDIFALGQVAAYASTGSPAFGEGTSHGVLYRIVHEEPDLTEVPERLRELVTRCLAKEPENRPSVAELLTICQEATAETVLRRPEEWLPSAVAAEIGTRKAAPAPASPTPPPAAPAATAPAATAPGTVPAPPTAPPAAAPTAAAAPAPSPATAPSPAAAPTPAPPPTEAAAPATPPPGFGPPPQAAYGYPQQPQPYQTAPTPTPTPMPAPAPPAAPKKKKTGRNVTLAVLAVLVIAGFAGGGAYLALSDGDKDDKTSAQSQDEPSGGQSSSQRQQTPAPGPTGDGEDGTDGEDGDGSQADGQDASSDPPAEPVADPEPATYNNLNVVDDYHLTFDDDPIKPVGDNSNADVVYDWSVGWIEVQNARLILLRNGQTGDLDTCRNETRYATKLRLNGLSKGSRFCVLTNSGHVGVVTYQGKSPDSDPSRYITLDVTVWRNALNPVEPTS